MSFRGRGGGGFGRGGGGGGGFRGGRGGGGFRGGRGGDRGSRKCVSFQFIYYFLKFPTKIYLIL